MNKLKYIKERIEEEIGTANKKTIGIDDTRKELNEIMLKADLYSKEYFEAKAKHEVVSKDLWWDYGKIFGLEFALRLIKESNEKEI